MSENTKHIVQLDKLEIGEHLFDLQLDSSYFSAIENSELLGGTRKLTGTLAYGSGNLVIWIH